MLLPTDLKVDQVYEPLQSMDDEENTIKTI